MSLNYQERDVNDNPMKVPLLHGGDTMIDIQLTLSWVSGAAGVRQSQSSQTPIIAHMCPRKCFSTTGDQVDCISPAIE
jgi:hypothetical protein